MFNSNQFDSLTQQLFATLPPELHTLEQRIREQFKDILNAAFTQMNLLTREEFDVHVNVLQRTREKVEALQQAVDTLTKPKAP